MDDKYRKYILKVSLFILSVSLSIDSSPVEEGTSNLVLVQVLYRHGDRSPVIGYPKDNFTGNDWMKFGAQGYGQLTWLGMQQQYKLGQFFRKRYIDTKFLSDNYNHNEIYVRSTDVDRTLMSAYCNLAGMYPPAKDSSTKPWDTNHTINWQPIPVHTVPEINDNILAMGSECPEADRLYEREQHTAKYLNYTKEYKGFFDFLSNATGMPHENLDNLWQTIDTLYCESMHNVTLPDWANMTTYKWDKKNRTVYDLLMSLQTWEFDLKYEEPAKKAMLRGGPLLKQMLENMKLKTEKKIHPKKKFYMYSAHDNTVSAFLSALKVYNKLLPQYASSVIVELYHNNKSGGYEVKIGYKNDTLVNPNVIYPMIIPGCTEVCPYQKFVNLTASMVPGNWLQECTVATKSKINEAMIIGIGVGGGIVLVLIFVGIVYLITKRRTGYDGYYGINNSDA